MRNTSRTSPTRQRVRQNQHPITGASGSHSTTRGKLVHTARSEARHTKPRRENMRSSSGKDGELERPQGERPGVNRPVECITAHRKWLPRALETMIKKPSTLAALLCFIAMIGCGSSPEVTSEEGQKCLDALYTAVTSKKPELLDHAALRSRHLKLKATCRPIRRVFSGKSLRKRRLANGKPRRQNSMLTSANRTLDSQHSDLRRSLTDAI